MTHYFLENQPEDVRKRASERKLSGPEFVGQGCTHRSGSDSYGYYVAEITVPGRLAALVQSDDEWTTSWMDGGMTCSMPADAVVRGAVAGPAPRREFDYIMRYGKNWYWCEVVDGKIVRRRGCRAGLTWNGAFSYRDPSL
jgi:hypothetical protein